LASTNSQNSACTELDLTLLQIGAQMTEYVV